MRKLKVYFGLILSMIIIALINTNSIIKLTAEGTTISDTYEQMVEEINEVNQLDAETIELYENYVSIIDGKYVFDYDAENNDDTDFIEQNITSINQLIDEGCAYIDEGEVLLYDAEELAIQFGVSNVKWHWYGINFKMDREMMITVAVASFIVRFCGTGLKTKICKGQATSSRTISDVKNSIKNMIKSPTFYETFAARKLNQTVILLDEKTDDISSVVEGLITAGVATYIAVQAAIACSTAGVGAIIMQVFNYVLGLYMPSIVNACLMIIGGAFGCYTVCNAQIRWFKGFGGYYSYC